MTAGRAGAALVILAAIAVGATWPLFSRPGEAVYDPSPAPNVAPDYERFLAGRDHPAEPRASAHGRWGLITRGDILLGIWTLAWGAHAVLTQPTRFFDANTLHPTPASLSYADHQIGLLPWFAPVYWTTGNPVLAYQVAFLLCMLTAALLVFVLVDRWTGCAAAGLVAAVAMMFAPFRLQTFRVLAHYGIPWLPAALLCVDALVTTRRRMLAALGLALCMAMQALCNVYMVYATFLLVPAYAAGVLAARGVERRGHAAGAVVAAALIAAVVVLLVHRPYLAHARAGLYPTATRFDGASPAYFWTLRMGWYPSDRAALRALSASMPGWLLAAAALGLLQARGRRRLALCLVVGLGILLAMGPTLHLGPLHANGLPWYWLARLVPGFTQQRHTLLTTTMIGVGLVGLVGLGVGWLLDRAARLGPRTAALAGTVLVVATVLALRPPRPHLLEVASGARVPPVYRWLAAHGGGEPILELPIGLGLNTLFAYFSTYHWLPLFNGGFAVAPPAHGALATIAPQFLASPERAAEFQRAAPITWVLVHRDLLPPAARPLLDRPPPHLSIAARFDDDYLFRTRR